MWKNRILEIVRYMLTKIELSCWSIDHVQTVKAVSRMVCPSFLPEQSTAFLPWSSLLPAPGGYFGIASSFIIIGSI